MSSLSESELARMRKMYDAKIASLYTLRREYYEWRTRRWVEESIETLEKFNLNPIIDPPWPADVYLLSQMYEVGIKNGKKILNIKGDTADEVSYQIVGMEDYFDILWEAHTHTGHSAKFKMQDYLRSSMKIHIPFTTVMWFNKFCKICQAQRLAPTKRTVCATKLQVDNHGFVELLDMRKTPDKDYVYIMHYREMTSNFSFLRPLVSPRASDVADELLKIFLEVGCPGILHTPVDKSFTESIIRELQSAWPKILIVNGQQIKSKKKKDGIQTKVKQWMQQSKSTEWSIGMLHVQYQMNCYKFENTRHTAFKGLIGMNPLKGFQTKGLHSIFDNLKYEEDLEKIVHLDKGDSTEESDEEDSSEDDNSIYEHHALNKMNDIEIPAYSNTGQIYVNDGILKIHTTDPSVPGPSTVQEQVIRQTRYKKYLLEEHPPPVLRVKRGPVKTYKRTKDSVTMGTKISPKSIPKNTLKETKSITEDDYNNCLTNIEIKKEFYDSAYTENEIETNINIDQSIKDEYDPKKKIKLEANETIEVQTDLLIPIKTELYETNDINTATSKNKRRQHQETNADKIQTDPDIDEESSLQRTTMLRYNHVDTTIELIKNNKKLSKRMQKHLKMWNTPEIDLPTQIDSNITTKTAAASPILDVSDLLLRNSAEFGEMPKEIVNERNNSDMLSSVQIIKAETLSDDEFS